MSELESYAKFTNNNPRLDFEFLYPTGWQVREVKGSDYEEVFILGPRNEANTYSLSLGVRVTFTGAEGGTYRSLDRFVEAYLAKGTSRFQEFAQARGTLAGAGAIEIEIRYTLPLPLNTVNPRETPIVERRIFAQKGETFYQIIYSAAEQDYLKYLEAFKEMVRTFEFRKEPARQVYWPLIVPALAYEVGESPARYGNDESETQPGSGGKDV